MQRNPFSAERSHGDRASGTENIYAGSFHAPPRIYRCAPVLTVGGIPIRLVDFEKLRDWENFDAGTGKDSAREIREYFIPRLQQLEESRLLPKGL